MKATPCVELLTSFRAAGGAIDAVLAVDPPGRAAVVGEKLLALWPGAAASGCVLDQGSAAFDGRGKPRPDLAVALRDGWRRRAPAGPAAAPKAPAADWPAGAAVVAEEVRFRGQAHGLLALGVPDDGAEEAAAFLLHFARCLAARLDLEALAAEAGAETRLADVGEASVPVAHEFNNFLNALMLHLAVLQYKPPDAVHAGLADVRQQAMTAAALIQQFQNYRRRAPEFAGPADLNRAARSAVAALAGAAEARETTLHFTLPPGDPRGTPVAVPCRLDLAAEAPAAAADLRRLCLFLLRNAAGAAAVNGGGVVLQTARAGGKVVLRVWESGPPVPAERLTHLFEPAAPAREGTSALELAACRTMARRSQGSLHAEAPPDGGVAFVAEWNDDAGHG